jgi:delta 1-pyrroline-5-carboxylate dehydrogenase
MTFIQPAASHFINGRYVDDTNGPVLELIYPANGQLLGQLHAATPAIVEEALASAKQAQKAWAATSGADALEYFGDLAGSLTGDNIQLGEDWVYTNREALGSVSEVEHGIIPLKSPVGKQPLRWHAAIQWCSNHQRQHRYVL